MSDQELQVAHALWERTRAEIALADNKASILLAGVLAASGGASAALGAARWSPFGRGQGVLVETLSWLDLVALMSCVVCLALVVFPRGRLSPGPREVLGYFGDVVALSSLDELKEILATSPTDGLDTAADQIWQLSHIVHRKFRLLRAGMQCLGAAGLLTTVVTVLAIAQ